MQGGCGFALCQTVAPKRLPASLKTASRLVPFCAQMDGPAIPNFAEAGYRHEALTLGGDPDKAEAHLPNDPSRFQQHENLDQGDASQPYRAQTFTGLPQRIRVPVQSSVLSDDRVSFRSRDCLSFDSSDLCSALFGRMDPRGVGPSVVKYK
jgi:hypothetical protein